MLPVLGKPCGSKSASAASGSGSSSCLGAGGSCLGAGNESTAAGSSSLHAARVQRRVFLGEDSDEGDEEDEGGFAAGVPMSPLIQIKWRAAAAAAAAHAYLPHAMPDQCSVQQLQPLVASTCPDSQVTWLRPARGPVQKCGQLPEGGVVAPTTAAAKGATTTAAASDAATTAGPGAAKNAAAAEGADACAAAMADADACTILGGPAPARAPNAAALPVACAPAKPIRRCPTLLHDKPQCSGPGLTRADEGQQGQGVPLCCDTKRLALDTCACVHLYVCVCVHIFVPIFVRANVCACSTLSKGYVWAQRI